MGGVNGHDLHMGDRKRLAGVLGELFRGKRGGKWQFLAVWGHYFLFFAGICGTFKAPGAKDPTISFESPGGTHQGRRVPPEGARNDGQRKGFFCGWARIEVEVG